jgi:DNA-binding FadR family transcriptional regulator
VTRRHHACGNDAGTSRAAVRANRESRHSRLPMMFEVFCRVGPIGCATTRQRTTAECAFGRFDSRRTEELNAAKRAATTGQQLTPAAISDYSATRLGIGVDVLSYAATDIWSLRIRGTNRGIGDIGTVRADDRSPSARPGDTWACSVTPPRARSGSMCTRRRNRSIDVGSGARLGLVRPAPAPTRRTRRVGATSTDSEGYGRDRGVGLDRIEATRSPVSERRLLETPPPFEPQIYRSLPEIERADAIVNRISKAIAVGLLKLGERLPPEAALSEMFGVGPATLREALAELRDRGVVETHRGRSGGTFVVKQPQTHTDIMREWFLSTTVLEIRDIGDEHSAIAVATIRLACERAEAHDFDRLQELARALVLAKTPEARAPADSRFHIELAVSAQSPRLANAEIRLQEETVQQLWTPVTDALTFDPEQATAEHLELVRAVAQDQPEKAQKLALEHIKRNIFHLIDTKLNLGYAETSSHIPATVEQYPLLG